jgi:FkbM family methyltransferase
MEPLSEPSFNKTLRNFIFKLYNRKGFKGRFYFTELLKTLFKVPPNAFVIDTAYGFKIEIDPAHDKGVESSLFYTGTYEPGTLYVMKSLLKPGDTFIDVGANIGLMSLFAASCIGPSGKILSLEPNPNTASILRRNRELNKFSSMNIIETAIGSEEGFAKIFPNNHINRGGASLIRSGKGEQGIEIKVQTLDYFIGDLNLNPVLVKIDVEGFELEVLKGSKSLINGPDSPALIIEYSSERATGGGETEDIFSLVKENKTYRVFRLEKSKESISNLIEIKDKSQLPNHDNIFCIPEKLHSRINFIN